MDSLGKLGTNLPAEVAAEKDLQAAFRGAALSLTGLFKVGKKATKKGTCCVCTSRDEWRACWDEARRPLRPRYRVTRSQWVDCADLGLFAVYSVPRRQA
jgi:hypothetical protein